MRSPFDRGVITGLALAVLGTFSCSLSYQSVYEGDVRFEHCYRLDDEPQVPPAEKRRCWADWSTRHTYGQTRDRVAYALARLRALDRAPALGPLPAAAIAESPKTNNASPQPTNAFAPPPQLLGQIVDGGSPDAEVSARLSFIAAAQMSAPGAACAGVCARDLGACSAACKADGCLSECDERYRSCMRSCF